VAELRYDNSNHKLYALTSRPGINSFYIESLCTVDPATGIVSNIADLPAVTNFAAGVQATINENDHIYYFLGLEQVPPIYLYSVNAITGSIINKAPAILSSQLTNDNLIFFRYDNTSNKMYGLFWEANTVHPPSPPPVVIDLTCRLDTQTKVYSNPSTHNLII
jgi:hypothetical protein